MGSGKFEASFAWPMTVNKLANSNDASCFSSISSDFSPQNVPLTTLSGIIAWNHQTLSCLCSCPIYILNILTVYWDMESVATFWHNTYLKFYFSVSFEKLIYFTIQVVRVYPHFTTTTNLLIRLLTNLTIKTYLQYRTFVMIELLLSFFTLVSKSCKKQQRCLRFGLVWTGFSFFEPNQ